jgi:hypothetical protein
MKNEAVMISQWLRAPVATLALALTCIPATIATADARTIFDGAWSVLIVTNQGSCDRAYRYGVQIADGNVTYDGGGGPITMQGRVKSSGAVQVIVQAGSQWASGSGRLNRTRGSGVWRGQGMSGACSGVWEAERRS